MFRVFLFMLALLGAGVGYLAWQGPGVIVDLAKTILRENGLPEIDFAVADLSLEAVTLEGIRIGQDGALTIPLISAVFTWRELIDGEVGEISIDDLEMTVRQRDQGLSFGELDPFVYGTAANTDGGNDIGAFHWPFRKLSLGNARITLLGESGALIVAMTVDGTVQRDGAGGLQIGPARISAASPEVNLTAAIGASVSTAGLLAARMELVNGAASIEGYDIQAKEGVLAVKTPLDDLSALEATGRLRVSDVALPLGFSTTGALDLSVRNGRLDATVRAEDADRGLSGTLAIEAGLAEPVATQAVTVAVALAAADVTLLPDGLVPVPLTGGSAELRLSMTDSLGNLQSLAAAEGLLALARIFPAVNIELKGAGIETAALPGAIDIGANMRLVHGTDGAVALHAPEGIRAVLSPMNATAWLALLGPLRQTDDLSPLLVTMTPAEGVPLLVFHPGEVLQKTRFQGALRAEGGALPGITADLRASAIIDPATGIFDAAVEHMAIGVERMVIEDFALSNLSLALSATANEGGSGGTAELSAGFSGGDRSTLHVPHGEIQIPASWQIEPGIVALSVRDCAGLVVPTLSSGDLDVAMKGVRFCLRQDGDRLVEIRRDPNGTIRTAILNAVFSTEGRDIVITRKDGWRARLSGTGNAVAARVAIDEGGMIGFDADVALGAVTLPSTLFRIDGVRLSAKTGNLDERVEATFNAAVTDLAKPFRVAPFDVAIDATANRRDKLSATGSIIAAGTPLSVEWEAEHSLSAEEGRATLRVIPFEFGYGVNQLSDITSLLNGVVSRPAGRLLGAASVEWTGASGCGNLDMLVRRASAVLPGSGPVPVRGDVSLGQLGLSGRLCADRTGIQSQAGQLLLENMEFAGDQISARAVNTNVDILAFHPFTTAPAQILSVGVVDLGFPLTDGVATFQVTESSRFDLDALTFNWAGGTVSVAPLRIAPDNPLRAVELTVDGAQLADLTELVPDKGISGEGILDGKLPIRLEDDGPAVDQGYLEARGPGILRYKRSLEEGQEPSAVDDVLSNLQYSKLRMDIDGGLNGGVRIGLSVEGKNPDYLDGYPVVLDVNVNGPLGAIMNDGLATYKVPSQILDRMRRFGQLQ